MLERLCLVVSSRSVRRQPEKLGRRWWKVCCSLRQEITENNKWNYAECSCYVAACNTSIWHSFKLTSNHVFLATITVIYYSIRIFTTTLRKENWYQNRHLVFESCHFRQNGRDWRHCAANVQIVAVRRFHESQRRARCCGSERVSYVNLQPKYSHPIPVTTQYNFTFH